MDKKVSERVKSDKRVKKVAKAMGGKVVSNSGATWFEKGDIVTKDTFTIVRNCKPLSKTLLL